MLNTRPCSIENGRWWQWNSDQSMQLIAAIFRLRVTSSIRKLLPLFCMVMAWKRISPCAENENKTMVHSGWLRAFICFRGYRGLHLLFYAVLCCLMLFYVVVVVVSHLPSPLPCRWMEFITGQSSCLIDAVGLLINRGFSSGDRFHEQRARWPLRQKQKIGTSHGTHQIRFVSNPLSN